MQNLSLPRGRRPIYVCHAMRFAMTRVFPPPVAIFMAVLGMALVVLRRLAFSKTSAAANAHLHVDLGGERWHSLPR